MGASTILGYLDVTAVATANNTSTDITTDATARAQGMFKGFAKGGSISAYPDRVADAAYYFALQQYAINITSVRQGNIGSANGGKVARTMLEKARGLAEIAKNGLARYEEWCKTYALQSGANDTSNLISNNKYQTGYAPEDLISAGADTALSFYQMNAADFVYSDLSADNPEAVALGTGAWQAYGAYGYGMKALAAKILARAPGYSDARNPEIGQYYQSIGNALSEGSKAIIDNYEGLVLSQKIQHAIVHAGV